MNSNFGRISTAGCINTEQPVDDRCSDPAFALANPDRCPVAPALIIKPSFALTCTLGSIQFKASYIVNGVETDVTSQTVFQSSDPNTAVIGAASGNATGLTQGTVTINASYGSLNAFGELTVLGDDCCAQRNVAIMVVVDKTKSMSQTFGGAYTTKLAYAKAVAADFISGINQAKDFIGLMDFTAEGFTVWSSPVSDADSVAAMVPAIAQSQQLTTFYDALEEAIRQLNGLGDVIVPGSTGTSTLGSGLAGIGSPEGVVTASPGRTYLDTSTGGFWVKRTGTGNTGWLPLIL